LQILIGDIFQDATNTTARQLGEHWKWPQMIATAFSELALAVAESRVI